MLGFFVPAMEVLYRGKPTLEVPAKERFQFRVITPRGGGKAFAQPYTPQKTVDWENHVGEQALTQLRSIDLDGDEDFTLPIKESRILAHIRFNVRKPPSYPPTMIHATKKPDLDNLVKAILDGIVQHKVIDDDACITDLQVMKRYADDEHPLGVEVELVCLPI